MLAAETLALGPERSLHFVRSGEGPDLVLIHGALTTHVDWLEGPFERLAERQRVTALDRPGHGLSRRPRFEGTPRDQARQVREGLERIGVERPVLVGHSIGGLVALAFAELFPDSVRALVLVAPVAFPEPRPLEHLLISPRALPIGGPLFSAFAEATFDRPLLKALQRLIFAPQPVPPGWEARYEYGRILDAWAMVAEGEEMAALLPFSPAGLVDPGAVRAPVLVVTGTSDRIVNPAIHARPLARLLPDARLVELEGIGHMPHRIATESLLDAMTSFESALEIAAS